MEIIATSVKNHGAIGDGVANDTAPFLAAIAELEAGTGGTLFIPRGIYNIASTLAPTKPKGVTMHNRSGYSGYSGFDYAMGCFVAAVVFVGSVVLVGALLLFAMTTRAGAREQYPGQYSQVDPEKREWYRKQYSPSGYNCCSEADGASVDEDIRGDEYWVRWDKSVAMHPETRGWMKVPAAVIIPGPNKYGPIVWWAYSEETGLSIRCYSRGPLF